MAKGSTLERQPEEAVTETEPRCRHYWIIESPRGATSKGVCKLCGASREFFNAASSLYWEDDSGTDFTRWSHRSTAVRVASDEEETFAAPRHEVALVV
jgi:hypothetical protein